MSDENPQALTIMTKTGHHSFESGHPRYGGKRKNSTQQIRDLCSELSVEPMRFLLLLVRDGWCSQVIFEGGKKRKVEVAVPLELRCDLAKYVSRFLHPVLSASTSQISGPDEGPIELARVNPFSALFEGNAYAISWLRASSVPSVPTLMRQFSWS